jgi:outer membrane lipoprotein SlyB
MEQAYEQPLGHEPAGTDSDNERALRAASVGGLIGAVAGGRSGPVGAGLGALVGGTVGYAIGSAVSAPTVTITDQETQEPIDIEVSATGGTSSTEEDDSTDTADS